MLRAWLRRWLRLESPPAPPESSVERRVAELEEHVDYLHLAVRKLRGRVTGGLRGEPARDGEGGSPVSDAPPAQRGNPMAIQMLEKRRGHVPR